jgi:hypothetical protein
MAQQLVLMNGEQPRPRATRSGLLDERTKQVGRLGLVRARAALAEANRRASERDAERAAQREDELARRAAAARRAARRLDAPQQGSRSTAA